MCCFDSSSCYGAVGYRVPPEQESEVKHSWRFIYIYTCWLMLQLSWNLYKNHKPETVVLEKEYQISFRSISKPSMFGFHVNFTWSCSYLPNSSPSTSTPHSWKLFQRDSCCSLPVTPTTGVGWNCGISLQARPAFAFPFAGGSGLLEILTTTSCWWHHVTVGNS